MQHENVRYLNRVWWVTSTQERLAIMYLCQQKLSILVCVCVCVCVCAYVRMCFLYLTLKTSQVCT